MQHSFLGIRKYIQLLLFQLLQRLQQLQRIQLIQLANFYNIFLNENVKVIMCNIINFLLKHIF
jgi:hypothetical protein